MNLENNTRFGQYRIIRLLGRGGMGEVYEAEHLALGRSFALKLLPPDFADDASALARFRREAKLMANLDHPGIVRVDDFGEADGRYWLRMELIEGVAPGIVTLEDFAAQTGGRIDQEPFVPILRQILEALAFAHEAGVIHRDLKPGNILLRAGRDGQPEAKITDFGLAQVIGEEHVRTMIQRSVSRSMSMGEGNTTGRGLSLGQEGTLQPGEGASTHSLVGTWEYMAPEQRRGEAADARSDVYAIGLICYRLLTGKVLGPKLPSEIAPELFPAWDAFVMGALEQEPAGRYENGRGMLEAFAPVWEALQASRRRQEQLALKRREQEQAAELAAAEQARAEEWKRQEEAREAARKAELEQLLAAQKLRAQQTREEFRALLSRATAFVLSRWGLAIGICLLLCGAAIWGVPAYKKDARARKAAAARQKQRDQWAKEGERISAASLRAEGFSSWQEKTNYEHKMYEKYLADQEQGLENLKALAKFSRSSPFVNTLGMKFVPVTGTHVLFSIWETRVKDFAAFAEDNKGLPGNWRSPGFLQTENHPVVNVIPAEAMAFCEWLTALERQKQKIASNQVYRLPTDAEWSLAVGLGNEPPPRDMVRLYSRSIGVNNYLQDQFQADPTARYPWGSEWPPPENAGNYLVLRKPVCSTSPVGSYRDRGGIYDLGGNVWEWCQDNPYLAALEKASPRGRRSSAQGDFPRNSQEFQATLERKNALSRGPALRGGSFRCSINDQSALSSSHRSYKGRSAREDDIGFRVVLAFEEIF